MEQLVCSKKVHGYFRGQDQVRLEHSLVAIDLYARNMVKEVARFIRDGELT